MDDLIEINEGTDIKKLIVLIRGTQVILDRDLARLYEVDVSQMNRQVKRNIERFPDDFMFQLTKDEYYGLKCHFGISNSRGGDRSLPFAFTEQGVSMLSGLLRSSVAIRANISIIRAFTAMKKLAVFNSTYFARMERIEARQLASEDRINELFNMISEKDKQLTQGIFFDGQIYDAYAFVSSLIRSAVKRIVLIDSYIDDSVLTMMDKRNGNVKAIIYTTKVSRQLQLDIQKHNAQYPQIEINEFTKSHDRFLIIDEKVYLIGASIKDLGKKWFGFTLMESISADEIMERLK